TQLCRQCLHNLSVGKRLSKRYNTEQVAATIPLPEFASEIPANIFHNLLTVSSPLEAQYIATDALTDIPIQEGSLLVDIKSRASTSHEAQPTHIGEQSGFIHRSHYGIISHYLCVRCTRVSLLAHSVRFDGSELNSFAVADCLSQAICPSSGL